MTRALQRNEMIELLERLGSTRDDEVLQAAREAHAQISSAGLSWDDLLVPDDAGTSAPEQGAPQADVEGEAEDMPPPTAAAPPPRTVAAPTPVADAPPPVKNAEPPAKAGSKDAESLALIEKMLAKPGISSHVRRELKDYKDDIAEGEFGDRDRRYIRALYKRMSKTR